MQEQNKQAIVQYVDALIARLKSKTHQPPDSQGFAEVYIEDAPDMPGAEPIVRTAASIPHDSGRDRFLAMRRISQTIDYSFGYSGQLQKELFYKQARLMEDFEDNYEGSVPFSMYFPNYQGMSYEQLRTYFTWRSKARKGIIEKTSFSYVFVYLYELINNVGVRDCEDGLRKLVSVWDGYRSYEKKLDSYMNIWVRDYYITNEFTASFDAVLRGDPVLQRLFVRSGPAGAFDYYEPCSDYRVRQSRFFTPQTEKAIAGCFNHVVKALDAFSSEQNVPFASLVFYSDSGNGWTPFSKALYCFRSRSIQNKVVRLSDAEVYHCENGRWTSSQNRIVRGNGRALVGYILRRIEQFYRKAAKYRYKLTADRQKTNLAELARLLPEPGELFQEIDRAIVEYYRLSHRKTITVDAGRLETIRANAQRIQEKLLEGMQPGGPEEADPEEMPPPAKTELPAAKPSLSPFAPAKPDEPAAGANGWRAFVHSLDAREKAAVCKMLQGVSVRELQALAQKSGVMLEVLADGINQKALDAAGDTLFELDDEITVFEEYRDAVEKEIDDERHESA